MIMAWTFSSPVSEVNFCGLAGASMIMACEDLLQDKIYPLLDNGPILAILTMEMFSLSYVIGKCPPPNVVDTS